MVEPVELTLAPGAAVCADLHLDADDADPRTEAFVAWLEAHESAPDIVVLGDLFEFWIGAAHADAPGARRVLGGLRARTEAGSRVHVVPGNRDFLLGRHFVRATGARLHEGGFVATLPDGGRAVFVHGDELCTLDRAYQRLRRVLRSSPVRALGPRLPAGVAKGIARRLRRRSGRAVAAKTDLEVSIQGPAARALAERCTASAVVCGHAHAHRDEEVAPGVRLVVLDAFGGARDTLLVDDRGELRLAGLGGAA